ncbi:hypothetical protein B0G71_4354 [Paraburkholderia sp. BL27I4N3]|uniref:hypothetical protein n=1 Tax=Paraburkholderia sp. BL27I4N3 TaxID=1938805 RepID=UPI000E26E1CE|nr:hypothetical protein [Paraburkholderia sp. BL27I4N3]REE21202.1 hypothetical protein B0G71_4354 [Paraburkholderia sp. BL27I4N3]
MSNLAELQHFSDPTATTPAFVKPAEPPTQSVAAPHASEDTRLFSMADSRAMGFDLEAAVVLGQIRYWWPKRVRGHRGVKKSYADWKKELGISKDKVQRINGVLVRCGMVEIYKGPWGRFKSESTFYVLTEKALAMRALAGKPPMLQKALAGNPPITENTKDSTKEEKTTPATVASLVASPGESAGAPGKTKNQTSTAGSSKKGSGKSSYFEDYKIGVESTGGFVNTPTKEELFNVQAAAGRLRESGRLSYEQLHEFFFLVGVHREYLQCHWKQYTSAMGYAGHGMPADADALLYVVGSKTSGKNRLWTALDAIGHHLTKEPPATSDTPTKTNFEKKGKSAAENTADLDAEHEIKRQAKLAAAASKARRDARAQRLGFADAKALRRELDRRRCAKVEAKYAKPPTDGDNTPAVPPAAMLAGGNGPAPKQAAVAPVITFTSDPIAWLEEMRFVGHLRTQREEATMAIIAANGWSKAKPIAVAA